MDKKPSDNIRNISTLSKRLSWLLRHGAVKEGLHIEANGFVKVSDILRHPNYKNSYSLELLKKLVENDEKQRYSLRYNDILGEYEIRANQGHSLKEVQSEMCLVQILSSEEISLAVHGTYFKHWSAIKREGLKRMSRNHVHFATSDSKIDNISGFRNDCQILIYLNVKEVLKSPELKLYRSDNNVILCSGMQNGSIPTKYFDKVVERSTGKLLNL